MSIYFYKNSVWLETSRATIWAAVLGLWRSQVRLGLLNLRAGDHSLRRRFSVLGGRFPKTVSLQMVRRAQPHVPQSTRGFVYCVWAERRKERTPFPMQATKGKSRKCPILEKVKPKPRGGSAHTNNKTGLIQHNICPSTSLPWAELFLPLLSFFLSMFKEDSLLTSLKPSRWV